MTLTPTVTDAHEHTIETFRPDATHFIDANLHDPGVVVEVRCPDNERGIEVSVDGDLCFDPYPDDDGSPLVRTADDVRALYARARKPLTEGSDLATDFPDGVWTYNRWFDLYDADTGDHLDSVCHDMQEAIADAQAQVIELPAFPSAARIPFKVTLKGDEKPKGSQE
jgi:hypothetical protein